MEMTPELAEICGIHAGDGYLRIRERNKGEVDISGNIEEKEYYDGYVVPLFNKAFNLNLKGRLFSRGTYGFVTYQKNVRDILIEFGFPHGKKSKIVKIPDLIIQSENKKMYSTFLRGLFDTDGNLYFRNRKTLKNYSSFKKQHNYYPHISFSTVSDKMSSQIVFLLNKLGFVNVHLYVYTPKKISENTRYVVYFYGVGNLLKFFNEIGSKNPIKLSRFELWKKLGYCPSKLTYQERLNMLNGSTTLD